MSQADSVGEGPSSYGQMPNLAPSGEFGNSQNQSSGYQNVVNARVAENM